uniref:Anaphase-promoting complex subunit 4-like WD40 domain-containing protein n=1 Tax=Phlebotomus papatasi TaxID=29031 RepID=A0A1B0D4Z5_PHLPP
MAWSPQGDLVATGSNDKTVKLMRYNEVQRQLEGREVELTMHDGTVRDLCFIEDSTNKASLLISAGAGDCKIYVTDCMTSTPFQALSGHGGHVLFKRTKLAPNLSLSPVSKMSKLYDVQNFIPVGAFMPRGTMDFTR